MPGIQIKVNANADQVRQNLSQSLTNDGYTVTPNANGSLKVEKGSFGKTMFLGALAGESFHRSFVVYVQQGPSDTLVSVNRNSSGNFLKGGAIGASKAQGHFKDISDHLMNHFGSSVIEWKAVD